MINAPPPFSDQGPRTYQRQRVWPYLFLLPPASSTALRPPSPATPPCDQGSQMSEHGPLQEKRRSATHERVAPPPPKRPLSVEASLAQRALCEYRIASLGPVSFEITASRRFLASSISRGVRNVPRTGRDRQPFCFKDHSSAKASLFSAGAKSLLPLSARPPEPWGHCSAAGGARTLHRRRSRRHCPVLMGGGTRDGVRGPFARIDVAGL